MALLDIVLLATTEIFGDTSFRWFAQTNNPKYFAGGYAAYLGVIYYLIRAFRDNNILYVNGMWDGISTIIESTFAFFVLGDRFDFWYQYVGLLLTVVGVYLVRL